jgi:WD40 repeat protein
MRRRKDIARLAAISAGVLLICGAMCQSTAGLEPIGVIGRGRLRQAEYLPDGRVLLVLDDRVDVAADDLETVLYSFAARSRGMGGVTVSHDGSRVAITTTRRKPERMTLEIWEVDSGVLLSEWTKIEPAGSFALNANLTAAVKYIGGDVLSVDVATGAVLGRFPAAEPEDDVRVALNPDATLVFVRRLQPVGERNGQPVWEWSTALWRRDLGQAVAVLRPKRDAWTYRATYDDAEFSPDGRWVAVRDGAQRITLWNVATGEEAWTSALPNSSRDIAFSHDSRSVHAFTDRLWTRAVDGSPPVLMGGGFEFPDGAAVSPDGTTALLRYRHGPLEEWDVATNVRRRFSTVHAAPESWGSALSADGRYVASIPGRVVTIWDLQHGDVARTVAPDDGFWRDAVASPSTPLFAVAHDLHIETRSFPSGKLVARSAAYFSDDVVAFSSDGAYLAFDGGRLDIAVSDATTGETVALLDMDPPDGHYSSVRRLVFGAGHRFLAARDREGWMYVWEWTGARYALRHT